MANAWFRMYSRFATDPDVQMMSEAMQRRLVMLMCRHCDGHVTSRDGELAFLWRVTDEDISVTKKLFLQNEFIDDQWNLSNWAELQFLSDSSKTRTKRYRERLRTSQKQPVTKDVTAAKRHSDAIDTDTEQIHKQQSHFVLPDWIGADSWQGYEEMRKRIRKPMTDRARKLAIADLENLRSHGEDPAAVLDQSTMNGWQGLFELRRTGANGHSPTPIKPVTLAEKMARQVAQA